MRVIVSAVLLIFLSLAWVLPVAATITADYSQTEVITHGDGQIDKMDCCEGSGASHQTKHVSCAIDCYFLSSDSLKPSPISLETTLLISAQVMNGGFRVLFFRPPISV